MDWPTGCFPGAGDRLGSAAVHSLEEGLRSANLNRNSVGSATNAIGHVLAFCPVRCLGPSPGMKSNAKAPLRAAAEEHAVRRPPHPAPLGRPGDPRQVPL